MSDTASVLARLTFPLTEEQRLVADAARDFARRSLAPGAADRDHTGKFPLEHVAALAQLGLLGMKVAAEDGGSGTDNVGYVLAMEAISESCASTAVILASSNLASKILGDHATAAQKDRFLSRYVRGELGPASFALTEPSGGSDASALRTTARADGDHFVLDGEKSWITSGAHAGIHVVFARTDGEGKGGISAFVVERGTPGLSIGKEEDKMGQRASGTVGLHFDGCRVPAANLIGKRGAGYGIALASLGAGRVGIAALSIGIAESALAEGLAYVKQRKVFGKTLADMQNTQMVLADSRMELDAAWLLMLRAARLLDAGERAGMESSMAKLYATEACGRIVDRVLQLHGGYGYSREYPIERHYRDARVTRIYEGTNEIQRIVIARELLAG
ncbi:MAG: Butyryl-CoA dehydrogenase [Labilithrix sp.]|nr:Butyryl-CoA dehydrogenase [Labilithrix sp.]